MSTVVDISVNAYHVSVTGNEDPVEAIRDVTTGARHHRR